MAISVGIDLGTYNSAAAIALAPSNVVMVESKHGEANYYVKNFPSFVKFDRNGEKETVGKPAKDSLQGNPELVIWGVKRLVGLSYEEALRKGELKRFKYKHEPASDGGIVIRVGGKEYSPPQILEFILREIKEDIANKNINPGLGENIEQAVITVPAYFDATRKAPIEEAAKRAGFREVKTIAEPTAAAIEYLHKSKLSWSEESYILVFDLGAGTLDVTVIQPFLDKGMPRPGELATSGNAALGGIDMDDSLMRYLVNKAHLQEMENDARFMLELQKWVEQAKIDLTINPGKPSTDIFIGKRPKITLTQQELEHTLKPLLERCRAPIEEALEKAGLPTGRIDHILFVGGPTQMPCVRKAVMDELAKLGARKELISEMREIYEGEWPVDPMECVARGAALAAAQVMTPITRTDPFGYGTELGNNYYYSIIKPGSNVPIIESKPILYGNPSLRRVSVRLVRKEGRERRPTFKEIGAYDLYIEPTGEEPEVVVTMEITGTGALVTTFTHRQTGQSVRLAKLHESEGRELPLQEDTPPESKGEKRTKDAVAGLPQWNWTRQHLERCVHVAQTVLDIAQGIPEVEEARTGVTTSINRATISKFSNPNQDCPFMLNRIQELLNALYGSGHLEEGEFRSNLHQLRDLETTSQ